MFTALIYSPDQMGLRHGVGSLDDQWSAAFNQLPGQADREGEASDGGGWWQVGQPGAQFSGEWDPRCAVRR